MIASRGFGDEVALGDGQQLSAFGRLRVAEANTLFDAQQEYGLNTRTVWSAAANGTFATDASNGSASSGGNAVGPTATDTRTPLVLSQIDALTATQTPVSVVCTSFSGTSNIAAELNWHEQSI